MNELRRELGLFGATMMGLGAMVGTGVFVSIWVEAWIWMAGLALVGAGLIWFKLAERVRG